MLPEARFIHIIRDGRDAALSLRKMWFSPGREIETQAAYWRKCVLAGRRAGLGRPDYLEVRYEDLILNTRETLGRICAHVDFVGVGPMVTTGEFDKLRPLNFGIRTLREPLSPDVLMREIARYDSADAAAVSKLVRSTAGHEFVIDELISLYEEVIAEYQPLAQVGSDEEGRAAAAYLRQLKIDFATHGAASLRLRERLERFPIFGRVGLKLVRRIIGHPGQ